MKKTARLILEVEYDDRVTDDESLCSAFDTLLETAMSTPGILDEYGNPKVHGFTCPPIPKSLCKDDARPDTRPLQMQVASVAYGIEIAAVTDKNRPIGSVVLDYHDNKLKALAYVPDADEPVANVLLCDDVDKARKAKPKD